MHTLLLVLLLVILGATTLRLSSVAYLQIARRVRKSSFRRRRTALFLVNPRKGRQLVYQTVDEKTRKFSWMLAQNNAQVSNGLKEWGDLTGLSNDIPSVDTSTLYGHVKVNKRFIQLLAERRMVRRLWDLLRRPKHFSVALKDASRAVRSILTHFNVTHNHNMHDIKSKPNSTDKGDSDHDSNE